MMIFFWICGFTGLANAYISPVSETDWKILDCAAGIHKAQQYANMLVIYTVNTQVQVDYVMRNLRYTSAVVLLNMSASVTDFLHSNIRYTHYLLLVSTVQEYTRILTVLYSSSIWNARGEYVVVYLTTLEQHTGNADVTEETFTESWNKYVINVDVVMYRDNNYGIYTYFPYNTETGGDTFDMELLAMCNESLVEPFPRKVPSNMHGCPITVAANIYPPLVLNPYLTEDNAAKGGSEVSLIHNILHFMNMSQRLEAGRASFSEKLVDGSYRGVLKHVAEGRAHLGYGTVFPNNTYFQDMDATVIYHYIQLSWVVPKALPIKPWASLVIIFQQTLWYSIIAALLINTGLWWTFGRITERDMASFTELDKCFFNSWSVLLQGSIQLPHSTPVRILLLFWVLFTLLLATMYQSQLVSVMTNPIYERQISNTEELVDSSLDIVYLNDFFIRLNNSNRPIDKRLVRKGHLISMFEQMRISGHYQRKYAFLTNMASYNYLLSRNYSYPSGDPAMYMFKQVQFGNPISMFTSKGYPLLARINQIIVRAVESGLFAKWIKDVEFYIPKVKSDGTATGEPKKINLEQLTGVFIVLAIGWTFAVLSFVLEVLARKCKM